MRFTEERLARICSMMGVPEWRPTVTWWDDRDAVLSNLVPCDSALEVMFALGVPFRLEFHAMSAIEIAACTTTVGRRLCRGIWVLNPWDGFRCPRCGGSGGPSGVILVPQLTLRGRPWDFGIVFTRDNGSTDGDLVGLVEVDGYQVHRKRRSWDVSRRKDASSCGLPVFGCREEQHAPTRWFDAVIHEYWRVMDGLSASSCPLARPCDVFLPGVEEDGAA
jgi:hypothetical protein